MTDKKTEYNKQIWAIIGSVSFIVMGIFLYGMEDSLAKIIGAANIIFWSAAILFGVSKIILNHRKSSK